MNVRQNLLLCFLLFLSQAYGQHSETRERQTTSVVLADTIDLHLTAAEQAIAADVTIDLRSTVAWLFFDNVKPNSVVREYADNIRIGGKPLDMGYNARVVVYRHGAVVIPHPRNFQALTLYAQTDFQGEQEHMLPHRYYSNCPPDSAPANLCHPLTLDNRAHSLFLRRGYMATLACEPNGMGYSRVFIADDADLRLPSLPAELNGKISYVRVMRWQYPSKKGWAGSSWSAMPSNLKYAPQQADFTNSTWYYNWGTTPSGNTDEIRNSLNQEFVPEKWGAGGTWSKIYTLDDVSHLLGYNEPDHSEQSNVSVARAIEEWPLMMQTGLRLGSPSTTDFTWLYNFMNYARQLNYRVDYVVVHAYWGGLSGPDWYERLKEVHERTGRPLWIKEWNNGANWTKEGWPSGTAEQQAKQLRDLQSILTVLDTCSFVERYSIYNWVEDKRMIISSSAQLTPAGEYYAGTTPPYFFQRAGEVVPVWRIFDSPVLRYEGMATPDTLVLTWNDNNGEQIDRFRIERNTGEVFETIATTTVPATSGHIPLETIGQQNTQLRITSEATNGTQRSSNTIDVQWMECTEGETLKGEALISNRWQPLLLRQPFECQPATLLGIATYRNKMPLTIQARHISSHSLDLLLGAWDYQEAPTMLYPDTIALLQLPTGRHDWNGLEALVDTLTDVSPTWQTIRFPAPFSSTPVVMASPNSQRSPYPYAVAIKNVTPEGFDVCLQLEGRHSHHTASETITYVAVIPGEGHIDGRPVRVGLTPEGAVGDALSGGYTLTYGTSFSSMPLFFGQMQTANDTITSTLRIQRRDRGSATLIRDREKSTSFTRPMAEQVGYMLIGPSETDGIVPVQQHHSSLPHTYNTAGLQVSPEHLSPGLYIQLLPDGSVRKRYVKR
ncbi:MAG: hypothetical protein IJ064_01635 [Bacteroidaceae bacterium]|nr:hypothetical protein [Bacteroidaceae bacterium]